MTFFANATYLISCKFKRWNFQLHLINVWKILWTKVTYERKIWLFHSNKYLWHYRALFLHGIKGFVIPTKSFVKIGIKKYFVTATMFSSINKTFGCCSIIIGCSNKNFFVVPNLVPVTKPFFSVYTGYNRICCNNNLFFFHLYYFLPL